MKIAFSLFTLIISFSSIGQDPSMKNQMDNIIEDIERSGYSKILTDTTGFYGSTDGTTVKGFYTETLYYDSLNQLRKVTTKDNIRECTFFFNDSMLIKAEVSHSNASDNYTNTRINRNIRYIKWVTDTYYYNKTENELSDKAISELIKAHPEQSNFLTALSIGISYIRHK